MSHFSQDQLRAMALGDDLHIAPLRADGVTHGTSTWIWSVVVADALYVRAYNGLSSRWYQSAMAQKAGQITVGGITHNVAFEPADDAIAPEIDDAYRAKYAGSQYLAPMIGARAKAATVKITPAH